MGKLSYILHTEQKLLHDFAKIIEPLFPNGYGPYQVGSSQERKDWHDIDLRVLLKDDEYDSISKSIDLRVVSIAISLWGQKVTGLPIDYQIQRMSDANEEFNGRPRNAVAIGDGL